MLLNGENLKVDLKAQDRLRRWLADRSENNDFKELIIKSIVLGDSDIDYRMSTYYDKINILNSPYQVEGIKNKLIFEGQTSNLSGNIVTYGRKILNDGTIASLYNYPPNNINYIISNSPPIKLNGYDINNLSFPDDNQKFGWVIFIQSLPDNYFDDSNNQLRYNEKYDIQLKNFPVSGWEFIHDEENGSFILAKDEGFSLVGNNNGEIKIIGKDTSITKTITFNY